MGDSFYRLNVWCLYSSSLRAYVSHLFCFSGNILIGFFLSSLVPVSITTRVGGWNSGGGGLVRQDGFMFWMILGRLLARLLLQFALLLYSSCDLVDYMHCIYSYKCQILFYSLTIWKDVHYVGRGKVDRANGRLSLREIRRRDVHRDDHFGFSNRSALEAYYRLRTQLQKSSSSF